MPISRSLKRFTMAVSPIASASVPFAMIGMLASNILLTSRSPFYATVLGLQVLFYGLAWFSLRRGAPAGILRLPSFFVLVNLSILHAWTEVARGHQAITWEPSRR